MSARPHFKLGTDGRMELVRFSLAGGGTSNVSALLDSDPFSVPSTGSATPPAGINGPRWYSPGIRDAAGDTLRQLPLQRGASRELVRSNPIATGAIQTNVDRTVGTGLALVAAPNRLVLGWTEDQQRAWKGTTQQEFSLWADSAECDWAGEQNFYDKQALTLRSSLESGDCFTNMPDGDPTPNQPYRLRLQTLEADRIANPFGTVDSAEVCAGVRRAPGRGVAQAYYVHDTHPGASLWALSADRSKGQWIDRIGSSGRRRILHHFRQLRPEQPRGVPYLAPIVGHLQQLGRYTEAEIKAAVVTSLLTLVIQSESGGGAAPIFGLDDAQTADAQNPDVGVALGSGATIGLAPGETANLINPLRPNPEFEAFVKAILQQIGMGLGLPAELLTKKFDASYSASKAALLDAWQWFRGQRTWLARSFCQPVYETWLAEAVSTGRIKAPGFFRYPLLRWAYTRAAWHGDSQGSINPKDEVAAYLAAVDGRIMTRERAEWELGGTDWYESFDAKKTENDMLRDADLLPVPKAGAPAPMQSDAGGDAPGSSGGAGAVLETIAAAPAPQVTVHLQQGDTTINLDGKATAVETVMPAAITVEPASAQVDVGAEE